MIASKGQYIDIPGLAKIFRDYISQEYDGLFVIGGDRVAGRWIGTVGGKRNRQMRKIIWRTCWLVSRDEEAEILRASMRLIGST